MSHYEERLENDLGKIRSEVSQLASWVEVAINNSVHALLSGDDELASATILGDGPINRKMREIDALCHQFVAVHLPSGRHLRLISSVIRINIILERIGDYAVTISRELQQLNMALDEGIARGIESLANEVQLMLKQAVTSFEDSNIELAKSTIVMASQVDNTVSGLYAGLYDEKLDWSLRGRFSVFSVYHRLERIADQAKNLCEQTVFTVLGEGKASKVYHILFIDDDNSCLSQMAEAIARKHFPESGIYHSVAGAAPATAFPDGLLEFMDGHAIQTTDLEISPNDLSTVQLSSFHVIVSLQAPVSVYIQNPPFNATQVTWNLTSVPEDCIYDADAYEEVHRELAVHIKDLMVLLRGEDAS
jgi:phosphate transport system protein